MRPRIDDRRLNRVLGGDRRIGGPPRRSQNPLRRRISRGGQGNIRRNRAAPVAVTRAAAVDRGHAAVGDAGRLRRQRRRFQRAADPSELVACRAGAARAGPGGRFARPAGRRRPQMQRRLRCGWSGDLLGRRLRPGAACCGNQDRQNESKTGVFDVKRKHIEREHRSVRFPPAVYLIRGSIKRALSIKRGLRLARAKKAAVPPCRRQKSWQNSGHPAAGRAVGLRQSPFF